MQPEINGIKNVRESGNSNLAMASEGDLLKFVFFLVMIHVLRKNRWPKRFSILPWIFFQIFNLIFDVLKSFMTIQQFDAGHFLANSSIRDGSSDTL